MMNTFDKLYLPVALQLVLLLFPGRLLENHVKPLVQSQQFRKTVLLDCFYNNEWRMDSSGKLTRYHYTWNDKSNSGFSMLGDIFNRTGLLTSYLETAPTHTNLKNADFYIIVDPDTKKESAEPNYMNDEAAMIIAEWVQAGGVLVIMANDSANAELKNFNRLASKFGMRFNEDNFNTVQGREFEQGAIPLSERHPIFKTARKLFLKEVSTLQVNNPAKAVLTWKGKNIMAVAQHGKGTVFAVGDPWLYNEYADGKRLPADFQNYQAAEDLVNWLIRQTHKEQ